MQDFEQLGAFCLGREFDQETGKTTGNLLLAFPDLRPEDFRPWVDEAEAARKGLSPDEFAARTAEILRKGWPVRARTARE